MPIGYHIVEQCFLLMGRVTLLFAFCIYQPYGIRNQHIYILTTYLFTQILS